MKTTVTSPSLRGLLPGGLGLAVVFTLAGILSACSFDEDFDGTRYRCADSGCPDGYACFGGFCETVLAAGATCGTTNVLSDDFEGESLDRSNWSTWKNGNPTIMVEQTNGEIVISLPGADSDIGGGVDSTKRYLFQSSSIAVEVPEVPDVMSEVEVIFQLDAPGNARAMMVEQAGLLHARYEDDNGEFEPATVTYSPTEHRMWQMREDGGSIHFEVSPDGKTWQDLGSVASGSLATAVMVELRAWLSRFEPSPKTIRFSALQGGGVDEGWCPSSMISDDFEDGMPDARWITWDETGCQVVERNGGLEFDHEMGDGTGCGYYTARRFDVSGSIVAVEVPLAGSGNIEAGFGLWIDDDNEIRFEADRGMLECAKEVDGVESTAASVPYNPIEHRWWRFRGDKGALHYEVSPDGKVWNVLATHITPALAIDEAEINLWSDAGFVPAATMGAVHFDNLNILPASGK